MGALLEKQEPTSTKCRPELLRYSSRTGFVKGSHESVHPVSSVHDKFNEAEQTGAGVFLDHVLNQVGWRLVD